MCDPEAFTLYRTSPSRAACPMGERLGDARDRMVAALQLIGSRHLGESVAAVTHAVMIRLVVAGLTNVEEETWRIPVGRGPLTYLLVENGSVKTAELPTGDDVDCGPAGGLAPGWMAALRPHPRRGQSCPLEGGP